MQRNGGSSRVDIDTLPPPSADGGRSPQKTTMLATAHVIYDRTYFETVYDDWLQHRSVWRRYAVPLSITLILAGVVMALQFPPQWLVGVVFAFFGLYELVAAATHRSRWINERLLLARNDKAVDILFDETFLTSTSTNGTSTMQFAGFMGFTRGSNGFFLIPDTGISLYIPRTAIEPAAAYDTLMLVLPLAVNSVCTQAVNGEQKDPAELASAVSDIAK